MDITILLRAVHDAGCRGGDEILGEVGVFLSRSVALQFPLYHFLGFRAFFFSFSFPDYYYYNIVLSDQRGVSGTAAETGQTALVLGCSAFSYFLCRRCCFSVTGDCFGCAGVSREHGGGIADRRTTGRRAEREENNASSSPS